MSFPRPHFRAVLSNRNFLLLWISQVVCAAGEKFSQWAILRIIFKGEEPKVAEGVSLVLVMMLLPGFIFGPLTARWVDRMDRRQTLIRADIIRAVLIACVPLLWFRRESLESFYALLFLLGLTIAFYVPARLALVPKLVPDDQLITANSSLSMAGMVGGAIGVPLGYWVAQQHAGLTWGCLINSVAYIGSALIIWRIRTQSAQTLQQVVGARHLLKEFFEGIAQLRQNKHALSLVSLSTAFNIVSGFSIVAAAAFAREGLDRREGGFGVLIAGAGVGFVVGAILAGRSRWATRWRRLPLAALAVAGSVMMLMPFAAQIHDPPSALVNLAVCTALMVFIGLSGAFMVVPVDTMTQQAVSEDLRGRIFAVRSTITTGVFLVALLGGAWVVKQVGAPVALWWFGLVACMITLMVLVAAQLTMRRHRSAISAPPA